jgi:EAL domain-containing protein (putative c-di-GMP-specific phosphodiesterase class I)
VLRAFFQHLGRGLVVSLGGEAPPQQQHGLGILVELFRDLLQGFDIDFLKIDRSFIKDIDSDSDDRALAEAIIVMAHKLGLKVVAEGVETAAQRDYLLAAGCDYVQGFLYARAMPAAEFEQLLRQRAPA